MFALALMVQICSTNTSKERVEQEKTNQLEIQLNN